MGGKGSGTKRHPITPESPSALSTTTYYDDQTQAYADQYACETARSLGDTPWSWELPWVYPAAQCTCVPQGVCDPCRAYYGARWRSLPRDYSPRTSRLDTSAEALAVAIQAGASYATLAERYGVSRTAMRYYCTRHGLRVSRRNTPRRMPHV